MTMKIMLKLSLIIAIMLLLYSCVHDEVYSSSDPASKEYINKSLWKEDEKYIKNVKKVFEEYADKSYFAANFGEVYWDYATTMGTYNESFLEVPVIKNGKINFILLVYREEDRIFFKKKEQESSIDFFASLVFTDRKKHKVTGRILNDGSASSKSICYTTETTVEWTNDDGTPGPTYTFSETTCSSTGPYLPCQAVDQGATCGGGHGNGGSGGSGGGGNNGYPYPPAAQNPCAKIKSIVSKPQIKDSLNSLKLHAQTGSKTERGFQELKSGTIQAGSTNADNTMFFGIGPNSLGTVHTHQPGTIGILAPQDIMTFLHTVRQQDASALGNAYSGTVSSTGTYFINFTGIAADLPPAMTNSQEASYVNNLVIDYSDFHRLLLKGEGKKSGQNLSNVGLQKLFNYLLNTMGLSGKITLVREEENGNTSTIQYDSNGIPTPNPC